ncbi:MAG: leucine-rich repeat domain-containing protein, partial [Candidatus Hodarchaeota archaeon]
SVYNWYKMQGGAKLVVDPFVTYGLYHPSSGERSTAYDEKYLYIPILINNIGPKTGLVTNVEITFRSAKAEEKVLKIEKRVESENKGGSSRDDFVVAVPQFPTFVPASEGSLIMFECFDLDNDVIPVDEDLICKITLFDGRGKKNMIEFPFRLSSVDLNRAKDVIWIRAFTADPDPSSDQFLLRKLTKEAGIEENYEFLLNEAYFDRSVESRGMKISRLIITDTKLKFLPECIGDFSELTELNLTQTAIGQSLPESIGKLKKLKRLKLRDTHISTLPDSIGKLTELEELDLSKNELRSLPDIGNLKKLKSLDLSFNKLEKLPSGIEELISLQTLYANRNELTNVPQNITALSNLIYLWLRDNQIVSIPEDIGRLSKLRSLALSNNQIESIPSSIGDLEDLQELEVINNNIRVLPETLFDLKNMITIVCSLKEIEEENFVKIKTWMDEQKKKIWNASVRSNIL